MATDKPRFSLTLTDEMVGEIEDFQKKNNLSTRNKAIQALVEAGMEELMKEAKAKPSLPCSNEALSIARRYDALEPDGKGAVKAILDYAESVREREETAKTKVIPLFGSSFAAGPGEPDFGNPPEEYEVPADSKATFAVKVNGKSMEPFLHDGEIYTGRSKKAAVGDVVAIMVDGMFYVKQYVPDNFGNLYLMSANREYEDVSVLYSSNQSVRYFGVIDCPHVPLILP